jgi:DNA polymerase-4
MGAQRALGRGARPFEEIDAAAAGLVDRVTRRMRKAGRIGRTVVLRLRFDDFTRATRSHTLRWPTAHTETILGAVRMLLAAARPLIEGRGLTLVGISVGNLDSDGAVQPELPFDEHSGDELDAALDAVRERFGSAAVTRGTLVGRGTGLEMPMLPD